MARKKKKEPAEQMVLDADPGEDIRLLELTVQNFRGLRFAHLKLDDEGRLIPVSGKNKAGKTSLLNAILSLTHGAKETPDDPINDQAAEGEKSFVRGKYSNGFTVEERFTEKGRYLTVVSQDGGQYKQGTLNEWIDGISGDPIHLWSLKDDRLLDVLLKTTTEPDAPAKLAEYAEAEGRIMSERTPHNSNIQRVQRMEAPDGERPDPVDLMDLFAQVKKLREEQSARDDLVKDRQAALEGVETAERNIQQLEEKLVEWRDRLAISQASFQKLNASLDAFEDPAPEIEKLEAEITRADEQEDAIEEWKAWDAAQETLANAQAEAERLTADLEEVRKQRAAYISGIESSVPGLTFTLPENEHKIKPLLFGRAFHAASGAQRGKFQIDTLFALNPKLKIILLPDDGDAFDADYLKAIDAESRERGYQVWLCTIREGFEGEIKIVEGRTVEDENDD